MIHKGGETQDPANYRPIALQAVWYKLYSYILTARLQTIIKADKLLSQNQSGWQFNNKDLIT